MAQRIPIGRLGTGADAAPVREQITTIAGIQRRIRFTWKQRPGGGAAYVNIENLDGTVIARNRRLTPEMYVVHDLGGGAYTGRLFVTGPDPYTAEQVGTEVQLWYLGPTETIDDSTPDPNLALITTVL